MTECSVEISYSTFYNFTCAVAIGLIYKPDAREWTDFSFFCCLVGGWKQWGKKNNLRCTKCIHSSLKQREDSYERHQTLRLATRKYLSETACYVKVKDRYTKTIYRNLASIKHSQLHHRYPIIDYQFNCFKNIVQHELIRLRKSPTSGFLGPTAVIRFKRLTVNSHFSHW